MERLSDDTLIQSVASGHGWALEALYQRYSRSLYAVTYRMVTDRQIAEDLVQESFLAIWSNARSYVPQSGTVCAWLLSIAYHRAIDYIRSLHRRGALKSVPLEEGERSSAMGDVEEEVWQSLTGALVREALMRLPVEQRLVIELAYFQGWTHREIAAGSQIPLGTVKARIRLGLMHMKRILVQKGINAL